MWLYRRIANRENFLPGAYAGDICLVNWPQNDYWLGNICEVSEAEAARHLKRAKQLSLSLLYWMQTERQGWKGLRSAPRRGGHGGRPGHVPLRARVAPHPRGVHRHRAARGHAGAQGSRWRRRSRDSVGVGSYRIDLHPSSGGDNYIDVSSLPFQIPLGALIHRRVENLLPAAKNLGVTHITNGCYRLHPVEWNIGESAALAAARAVRTGRTPREIRNDKKLLAEFQAWVQAQGVEIAWPRIAAQ